MRITSFQEKMKKKTSEFTFQLEGTVDKDGFCDMIRHTASAILTALWSVEGDLRPFEKITLPPVVQDSIRMHNKDTGDMIATIMNISWSSIKAERDSENRISFVLKGKATMDEDQLLAMRRCISERINLNVHWFEAQQELPLEMRMDDAIGRLKKSMENDETKMTISVNGKPPVTISEGKLTDSAKKLRSHAAKSKSATTDTVQ